MRVEFYYKKADAMKAAERFAKENGKGVFVPARADDKTKFDYEDDRVQGLCWSGEVQGVGVICENTQRGFSPGGKMRRSKGYEKESMGAHLPYEHGNIRAEGIFRP